MCPYCKVIDWGKHSDYCPRSNKYDNEIVASGNVDKDEPPESAGPENYFEIGDTWFVTRSNGAHTLQSRYGV